MIGVRVDYSGDGEVVTFSLEGRTQLNLVGSETLREASARVRACHHDARLRCAVLRGSTPGNFIGGADLKELGSLTPGTAEAFIRSIHEFCAALRALPVPVVARIAGHCLGAGLEIAAACDLRVAATDCRFGMPEVRVGVPSVIEAALLPSLIGWGRTRELVLRGHLIDGETAARIGLVEQLAPSAALDALADTVVDDIRAGAPLAVRAQKRLCQQWERLPLREAVEAGVATFVDAYASDEPARYVAAFFAGRHRN